MILRPFPLAALYRVHSPKWAHLPTSGAGAASQGGRLNRKGVDALYLSLETETALAEYQQTSPLLPPGTIASYQVELSQIVDFSGGYNSNWDPLWEVQL
ncbi:RES family NAD+ phosphorylase [Variovorax beijingensis]|uniref:RES family NAD+ phosphorylase n=1 Tax=Variovorax beijingensis TaxID=2496117 RepID=UPI0026CF2013|nr:RES domain-containing protein [Variovorax beijingensis]